MPADDLSRRSLLCLPAALALPPLLHGREIPGKARLGKIDFATLMAQWQTLAQGVLKGETEADAFLTEVEHLATDLDVDSVPAGSLQRFSTYEPKIEFGRCAGAPPTLVIQWQFAPGAVLPPHNHTPALVLSLCLRGECRVRHFEIDGAAPAAGEPGAFQVRESHSRILRPGRATSLSQQRDNIHTFEAGPDGALGIDLNVFLPGTGTWSNLELGEVQPGFAQRRAAKWIGKPPK